MPLSLVFALACLRLSAALRTLPAEPDEPSAKVSDAEETAAKAADFAKLKDHIAQVCRAQPDEGRKAFNIFLEQKHNVAYCMHNKAASTTIMRHIVRLHDPESGPYIPYTGQIKAMSTVRMGMTEASDMNAYRRANGTFVFTFARHPFRRLVSAYIDKIAKRNDPGMHVLADRLHGSWHEFVDFVLNDPTDTADGWINPHWAPFSQHCDPCKLDYDFIGRLENFTEDMRYVVKAAGLAGNHLEVGRVRRMSSQDYEKSDHGERTAKYMAMLSKEKRQEVYEFYKRDFDLLGYSPEPYL